MSAKIIIAILAFISLCCHGAQASPQDRQSIISLSLSRPHDFEVLNSYLLQKNVLNYLKVRERLLFLSYDELAKVQKELSSNKYTALLQLLIQQLFLGLEKEGIFTLLQDIFVDNQPLSIDSPFYQDASQEPRITDIKPYASRVYFYNLKLRYKKNSLIQLEDDLWGKKEMPHSAGLREREGAEENLLEHQDYFPDSGKLTWSSVVESDNRTNFVYDLEERRLWTRTYEENPLRPVIYKGTVLIRNSHRIFCQDLSTGSIIWSFNNREGSGREFYQTLNPIYHNRTGYALLVDNDILYSELDGRLVAIDLKDIVQPKMLWEKDIGEYRVYTAPVKSCNNIIIGLMNDRGELWICGFSQENANLEWSTYIGTSSYNSSACEIYAKSEGRVFIATNHGVLTCLNPENGEIFWIKKYLSKNYSLLDYFFKRYYYANLTGKSTIEFDTQFIELSPDNSLYYKARDSNYLYILDQESGALKEKILVDSSKYYILREGNGKGLFLKKPDPATGLWNLEVVDLSSGTLLYSAPLQGNVLKGVVLISPVDTVFKIDNAIHFIRIKGHDILHKETTSPSNGWLLYFKEPFVFVGDNRKLSCINIADPGHADSSQDSRISEFLAKTKEIKDIFLQAVQGPRDEKTKELINSLEAKILTFKPSPEIFLPLIITWKENLKGPLWDSVIAVINKVYADSIITYQDIQIKFGTFLLKEKLVSEEDRKQIEDLGYSSIPERKNYDARLPNLSFVPIKIIKGNNQTRFFLITTLDQLFCINENGNILWERDIFNSSRKRKDQVEACLYEDTLIVNDHVNIIAVNVLDGSYIWSMTNNERSFDKRMLFLYDYISPLNRVKNGISREYLKNVSLGLVFSGDRMVVSHRNNIYSIDPLSGYCYKNVILDNENVLAMNAVGDKIYILPFSSNVLMEFNNKLESGKAIKLGFLDKNKNKQVRLLFAGENIVLCAGSNLYLVDMKSGVLKDKLSLGKEYDYLETSGKNILLIDPFNEIRCLEERRNKLTLIWKTSDLKVNKMDFSIQTRMQKYYIMVDKAIWMLIKKMDGYFMQAYEIKSGKLLWESPLNHPGELFHNLTDYKIIGNNVFFVFSTAYNEEPSWAKDLSETSIFGSIYGLDPSSGKAAKIINLPSIASPAVFFLGKTSNFFLYSYGPEVNFLSARLEDGPF